MKNGLEILRDFLERYVKEWIDQTVPFAAARAGVEAQNLRRRISVAGSHISTRFNGSTSTSDNWGTFEIRVNVGLSLLANRAADLFVAHVGYMGQDGNPTNGGAVSTPEFLSEMRKLIATYWASPKMYDPFQYEIQKRRGVGDEHSTYAALLAEGMHRFVIGHELGHVIMRTTVRPIPQYDNLRNALGRNLNAIPESARQLYDEKVRAYVEELTCDWLGIALTNDYFRSIGRVSMTQVFTAAELFFLTLRILERSAVQTFGPRDYWGEHPPTEQRLRIIRFSTAEMPPHVQRMGKSFESVVAEMIDRL